MKGKGGLEIGEMDDDDDGNRRSKWFFGWKARGTSSLILIFLSFLGKRDEKGVSAER